MTTIPCNTNAIILHNVWRAELMDTYARVFIEARNLMETDEPGRSLLDALDQAVHHVIPDPLMRPAAIAATRNIGRTAFHGDTEWNWRTLRIADEYERPVVLDWLDKVAKACYATHAKSTQAHDA